VPHVPWHWASKKLRPPKKIYSRKNSKLGGTKHKICLQTVKLNLSCPVCQKKKEEETCHGLHEKASYSKENKFRPKKKRK
jgi:hypothetical protein